MRPSTRALTFGFLFFAAIGCQRDELAPYAFPRPVEVACESPPPGYLGVAYSWTPEHQFGAGDLFWSAVGLPPGLTIDENTGEISGVPEVEGSYDLEITVRDSSEPAQISVVTCGSIEILPGGVICGDPGLPDGILGEPYMHTLMMSDAAGVAPYVWAVTGLPAGLELDATTGVISGVPTEEGDFPVSVVATDATGTEFPQDCGDLSVFPRLDVDGDKLLEVYPDGCVGPGVTITDLIDNGVLVGGNDDPIVCEFRGGLGNGNFPPGVAINPDNCGITGTVATSERYGMHVWTTSFSQGSVTAHVPYCAPQAQQPDTAYEITKSYMGAESTLKPGTTQQAGGSASYGGDGDPRVEVLEPCLDNACFFKFYFAYNTLSAMASVSANPNGKLGEDNAFDGFFHSISFSDPAVSAAITGRHWVVNIDYDYCISNTESNCDTKDKAIANGGGSNYTFGVIVRP